MLPPLCFYKECYFFNTQVSLFWLALFSLRTFLIIFSITLCIFMPGLSAQLQFKPESKRYSAITATPHQSATITISSSVIIFFVVCPSSTSSSSSSIGKLDSFGGWLTDKIILTKNTWVLQSSRSFRQKRKTYGLNEWLKSTLARQEKFSRSGWESFYRVASPYINF